MKIKIFWLLIVSLIFNGINGSNPLLAQDEQKPTIYPALYDKIIEFIDKEEIPSFNPNTAKVAVFIVAESKENECFISIGYTPFYVKKELKGYCLINDQIVVFYDDNKLCSRDLIDYSSLLTGEICGMDDENSRIAEDTIDPKGWKFKIKKDRSLELIHKGFL